MIRLMAVIVFAVMSSGFVGAQPPAAGVGPVVVDSKVLRRNLGARVVEWDPASRVMRLTYDFRKPHQEKDWQMPNRKVNATVLGIRIAAGERLTHKAVFTEATCAFRYSCGPADKGPVIEAGGDVTVTTYARNIGRCFAVNGKQKAIGKIHAGPISIALAVDKGQARLRVNNGEVAAGCANAKPFQFVFLGGDNGAEYGELEITGKPDEEWLKAL
jgi:hypothetical protein